LLSRGKCRSERVLDEWRAANARAAQGDQDGPPEAIMHGVSNCPDAQSLQRFLLGRNTPEEATALEEHLESCDQCLATMQTLHADDSMVAALQARNDTEDVTANDGVR
jgi:Putative zinc-finger